MIDIDYSEIDKLISKAANKFADDIFDEIDLYIGSGGNITIALYSRDKYKNYNLAEIVQNNIDECDDNMLRDLKITLEKCLQIVSNAT